MPKISKYYWFVTIAGTLSGLVVFGGQVLSNFGLSLLEISIIPFLISLIILIPIVITKKQWQVRKGTLSLFMWFGVVEAIIVLCQFGALKLGASVAMTVLLLYTQPLWTMLISYLFLNEKISRKDIWACILVLGGMILLVNPFHLQGTLAGIIVALLGGIGLSGWVTIGSYASKNNNPPLNTYFISRLFMTLFLFIGFFMMSKYSSDPNFARLNFNFPALIWGALALFGIVAELMNNIFYLNGVKKVRAIDAGIIMLLEPIVGTILAMIFLHQPITLGIVIGGGLILTANYLVIMKESAK
jgi:drug/metabolite transporter (DMT)-like permease